MSYHSIEEIKQDLRKLGIQTGDTVLIHSSFKAMGEIEKGAEGFFEAIFSVVGETGTVMFPTLSFSPCRATGVFHYHETPSCVGYLSNAFRVLPGVKRSLHPTHSCAAKGPEADFLVSGHELDTTPVGPNSPFTKMPLIGGKILMIGCSIKPMTAMHGVEETIGNVFLLNEPQEYTLTCEDGTVIKSRVCGHAFSAKKLCQRYDRLADVLPDSAMVKGNIGDAESYLLDAATLWQTAHKKMKEDPYFFTAPYLG